MSKTTECSWAEKLSKLLVYTLRCLREERPLEMPYCMSYGVLDCCEVHQQALSLLARSPIRDLMMLGREQARRRKVDRVVTFLHLPGFLCHQNNLEKSWVTKFTLEGKRGEWHLWE